MFKFLLAIVLFFLLASFLLGFSLFQGIRRIFFSNYNNNNSQSNSNQTHQNTRKKQNNNSPEDPQEKITRKLFESAEDEGEYVDFEEIKDKDS